MLSALQKWALIGAVGTAQIACGGVDVSDSESMGYKSEELVSSGRAVTPFGSPNAAETAITIVPFNGTYNKIVAFNYDDPAHITYTSTTRTTTSGASGIGWNYAIGADNTNNFTASPKRLTPPVGWPILWGDPGLGNAGNGRVFMTTLAVPQSKMPASGSISGPLNDYLGGGCVARSSDGGQNFTLAASDCLHDANFSFYDGSDVAGTGANGPVAAAFYNVTFSRIDVWIAPTPTSSFSLVGTPFPGKIIDSHPRLAQGSTGISVIAPDGSGNLWLASYVSGAWTAPLLVGTGYSDDPITIGGQMIRRGPQYDLAVVPSTGGPTATHVVYAKWNGHSYFTISRCTTTCTQNFMTVDPGVHVFHPAIGAVQQGNPGGATTFEYLSWMQAGVGTNVNVFSTTISSGSSGLLTGHSESGATPVCPDTRGYWGDYDAHLGIWPRPYPAKPMFWRAFTDSTDPGQNAACTQQWKYRSTNVNVSATWLTP